jgi:hypothetical protein
LGSPGIVEMIFDFQSLRDSLGDFSLKSQPIVTLERPDKSKSVDNLINWDFNYLSGLFRGTGECFNPFSEGVYQNQKHSRGWASWQVGEVKLPVLPQICSLPLCPRDRQGSVAGGCYADRFHIL